MTYQLRSHTRCCLLLALVMLASGFLATEAPLPAAERATNAPSQNDWPWWRGPQHTGIATPGQKPPLEWGPNQNVAWRFAVPGRGHA